MKPPSLLRLGLLTAVALMISAATPLAHAGGTLTPADSTQAPVKIRSHQVNVTLNNGFARTEVVQTFFNPNGIDLEAIYAFPVPKRASLSEVTIRTGEKTLQGEVLPKQEASTIYEEEKSRGNDAGLTSKNGYQRYEFRVSPVRANSEVNLRFVYYEPLEIDTGIGRYVYPLEDGGTDDVAKSFWTTHSQVEGQFLVDLELKSTWPVEDVRVPGFESAADVKKLDAGHYRVALDRPGGRLDRDFVFYYRLADNLPGRVEVIPYRADPKKPGTFMMVVTPGIDLKPLTGGADYSYVLDISGSMQGKLHTLANGVTQALGTMRPDDRFRVVTFNDQAKEVIGWTSASSNNVRQAIEVVKSLRTGGGTNVYEGVQLGLKNLDADRATSVVLVTDGVANQGIVEPARFHRLLAAHDVRVFGFLMGNSANWPLMRTIAEATGGFYAAVSNDDDIIGQIILAKSKITHEALHHASFSFSGARVFDTTGDHPKKIYYGQQLVIFGRYETTGRATVQLKARLTGEDKVYTTTFDFPEIATEHPEIERLWALAQIEEIELEEHTGELPASEAKDAITHLGVTYQLVTDHTSMLLLDDETFAARGIDRRNQRRVALEHAAQAARANQPVKNHRVDAAQPMYTQPAPHVNRGGGGGALDREDVVNMSLVLLLVAGTWFGRKAMRSRSSSE
jgi:Ca-activated chloride channel homolog